MLGLSKILRVLFERWITTGMQRELMIEAEKGRLFERGRLLYSVTRMNVIVSIISSPSSIRVIALSSDTPCIQLIGLITN